jgi:hypothetical protein
MLLLTAGLVCLPSLPLAAREFHVAGDGNDTHPGTEKQPFATLEAARDAARKGDPNAPRRIVMHGGAYYDVALVLEPRDSGLAIEAAPGEKPVLYGGRPVTGWKKDGDKFYAADLPGVRAGTLDFRSLVVNGDLRPRARLPKTGEFTHLTRFGARWHASDGGGFRGADKPELKLRLQYKPGDIGPWLDVRNAELDIIHSWDSSMVGLKSHDPETRTLVFSNPSGYPPGAFNVHRYVLWNVREGMHEPGQWYLDRTRGKVVYWPKPGEDIGQLSIVAPTTEAVITLQGTQSNRVSNVVIEGLQLRCTTTPLKAGTWAAIVYQGAVETAFTSNCTFRALHIAAVGGQGMRHKRGSHNLIQGCTIERTGAGGIYDMRGSFNRILDNRIHRIGRIYVSALGMTTYDCWKNPKLNHDNLVARNEIADTPYVGIEFKGVNNRYESNLVSRAMAVLEDGAAFYGNGKNHILRGNLVRDLPRGKSAHAYYIDELGHDILVENNIALNCDWPVHVHLAHDNTYRNNLFVTAGDCKLTFPRSRNITMEQNVIHAGGTISARDAGAVAKWARNVFFSRSGRYQGLPNHAAQHADPLFIDASKANYRFQTNSPALKLGIMPFDPSDLKNVGPRKSK